MKLRGARVLATPVIQEKERGFYLPNEAKDYSQLADIVEVGEVQDVKPGDRIIYSKYAFEPFGDQQIIQECDILAIVSKEGDNAVEG